LVQHKLLVKGVLYKSILQKFDNVVSVAKYFIYLEKGAC